MSLHIVHQTAVCPLAPRLPPLHSSYDDSDAAVRRADSGRVGLRLAGSKRGWSGPAPTWSGSVPGPAQTPSTGRVTQAVSPPESARECAAAHSADHDIQLEPGSPGRHGSSCHSVPEPPASRPPRSLTVIALAQPAVGRAAAGAGPDEPEYRDLPVPRRRRPDIWILGRYEFIVSTMNS